MKSASEWLLSVAALAKQLNQESKRDGGEDRNSPPTNNGK